MSAHPSPSPFLITPPLAVLALPGAGATAELALRIGPLLGAGDVVLLDGPIGAGKTHFARSLIQDRMAQGGRIEDVPSPTFTLVQVYDTTPEIWHSDLYRLTHPDEVIELGLDLAMEDAVCLIEWPDRLGSLTPATALGLAFRVSADGHAREVSVHGDAAWQGRLAEVLALPFETLTDTSDDDPAGGAP